MLLYTSFWKGPLSTWLSVSEQQEGKKVKGRAGPASWKIIRDSKMDVVGLEKEGTIGSREDWMEFPHWCSSTRAWMGQKAEEEKERERERGREWEMKLEVLGSETRRTSGDPSGERAVLSAALRSGRSLTLVANPLSISKKISVLSGTNSKIKRDWMNQEAFLLWGPTLLSFNIIDTSCKTHYSKFHTTNYRIIKTKRYNVLTQSIVCRRVSS